MFDCKIRPAVRAGLRLYSDAYSRGFGTLYKAAYHPALGRVEYRWPDSPRWCQSFAEFTEDTRSQLLTEASVA